jgi:spore germination cell wall hydrolase CwlJ-like protein
LSSAILSACATTSHAPAGRSAGLAAVARGYSDESLQRLTADMDRAMLALARRHDPGRRAADLWDRPQGWADLDLARIPDLGLGQVNAQTAREINALRPFASLPVRPMRPFTLRADPADAGQALRCLSQAVYYEAAREPLSGQQAVAQVVLNRLRHPAYPKSVCGVVFQGAGRPGGCQFSFTCDGSLRWRPEPGPWVQAQAVARRALAGFVQKDVGSATRLRGPVLGGDAGQAAPARGPHLLSLDRPLGRAPRLHRPLRRR